ncbi:MAG: T9SS type A sorting domain-containing protein [Bacteroidia bacterium]
MKKIQLLMLLMLPCCLLFGQNGEIKSFKIISATKGGFNGITSPDFTFFGKSVNNIGDLDLDGIDDYCVGASDNNALVGNLFVLFMDKNFNVKSYTRIAPNIGGFNGSFNNNMRSFASTITSVDLNKDGVNEVILGNSTGGGNNTGEVYILFLNKNGTVSKWTSIGSNNVLLTNSQYFGISLDQIGDLNKDGSNDIVVGSVTSLMIVFLDSSGDVKSSQKISKQDGNFKGVLGLSSIGFGVAQIGDLNKDGNIDLISSSIGGGWPNYTGSALWILYLNSNGSVKSHLKIDNDSSQYMDTIRSYESFGSIISNLNDLDGDGNPDVAVTSLQDSVNNSRTGRVRILFFNSNGTVKSIKRIDNNATNFSGILKDGDNFGSGLSGGFDLDGDFKNDLLVGALRTDDGGTDKGAIYLLSLDGAVHPTPPKALWRVNATSGNQNTVFNFTQYSTGFPSAYKWSITPNTFTYQSGTSDTSANPIIKFNQTANYSVQLKVTNPFSSDSLLRSSYISIQKVGINNLTNNNSTISIFPNPTNGLVQIQSPITIQSILVFDITGKQLLQQAPNTQTDEINISNLPQGLYQIHVQTAMGVLVKKLVKE